TPADQLVFTPEQELFGKGKEGTLPAYCRSCEYLFACFGECPKNRFLRTPEGEPGLNYLCSGWKRFFKYIDEPVRNIIRRMGETVNIPDTSQ
ncbi:MAG: SPASM domain-containing protein, partial [Victivallales bacterium]|nr:SPASM domain-containing protein [Victivallales bacterium]